MVKYTSINLNNISDVQDFVGICQKIDGDVLVSSGRYTVNGKSLLGLFSLNLTKG